MVGNTSKKEVNSVRSNIKYYLTSEDAFYIVTDAADVE